MRSLNMASSNSDRPSTEAVMSIRNFGEKSLDELRQKMQEKGFLKEENDESEVE